MINKTLTKYKAAIEACKEGIKEATERKEEIQSKDATTPKDLEEIDKLNIVIDMEQTIQKAYVKFVSALENFEK